MCRRSKILPEAQHRYPAPISYNFHRHPSIVLILFPAAVKGPPLTLPPLIINFTCSQFTSWEEEEEVIRFASSPTLFQIGEDQGGGGGNLHSLPCVFSREKDCGLKVICLIKYNFELAPAPLRTLILSANYQGNCVRLAFRFELFFQFWNSNYEI